MFINRSMPFMCALAAVAGLLAGCTGTGSKTMVSGDAATDWREEFGEKTYDAWATNNLMPQLSQAHPDASLEDGYRVQEAFVARILEEDAIGGYKAAVVGAAGQENLGTDGPITGVVPASGVMSAASGITIDLAAVSNQAVETEIGYTFRMPVTGPLNSVEDLRAHVEAVMPVIEIPGGASEEVTPATAADLAARNVNAMKIIVGPAHDPEAINEDAVPITLTHDGEVINEAQGGQAAGGQWETLLKTVNNVVSRGYTVEIDHVITNGALGKILPLETGAYRADYGPLGVVEFTVVDSSQ